jgi:hypothetical protein
MSTLPEVDAGSMSGQAAALCPGTVGERAI